MLNMIKTLVAPRGISGREKAVSDKLLTLMAPLTDNCRTDAMGSLIALKKGTAKIKITSGGSTRTITIKVK